MTSPLRIYGLYLRMSVAAGFAKPQNFVLGMLALLAQQITSLAVLLAFLRVIPQLNGWTTWQLVALFSVANLIAAVHDFVLGNAAVGLEVLVRNGAMDRFFVRPAPVFLQVAAARSSPAELGNLVLAVGLITVAATQGGTVTPERSWLTLPLVAACGVAVVGSLNVSLATTGFWLHRTLAIRSIGAVLTQTARFPAFVYPFPLHGILSTVIPLIPAVFVPVSAWFGKAPLSVALTSAAASAAGSVLVASLLWRQGLRAYQ